MILEYIGEYGSELGCFVPFIYYLKTKGLFKDIKVKTYDGMKSYYFFLDDDEIEYKNVPRQWVNPKFRYFLPEHIRNDDIVFGNMKSIPTMMTPPDYIKQYGHLQIQSEKPIYIIQNKYNSEWGGPPVNFFDTTLLDKILEIVTKSFTVIYIRSNDIRLPGYSDDENEKFSFKIDDKQMISQKYPDVILFENLLKEYSNYDFNTLKCIVHCNACSTLSTIGGFNFFDAYFPSKHYIYRVDTPPIYTKDFYQNQHNMLCPNPNEIYFTSNKEELIEELELQVQSRLVNS